MFKRGATSENNHNLVLASMKGRFKDVEHLLTLEAIKNDVAIHNNGPLKAARWCRHETLAQSAKQRI